MILLASILSMLTLGATWLSSPLAPQLLGQSFRCVNTQEKVVAITFDDGPNPDGTPGILELLEKEDIKATFFLIGNRVQQHPEFVQQILQAGHQVGNHSWDHPLMLFKSPAYIKNQIEETDKVLRGLGHSQEIFFRAPYGMKLLMLPLVLRMLNKTNILFDAVAYDWSSPGVEKIVHNVLSSTRPGSIILMHDGVGNQKETVVAAEKIIDSLKSQGYRFLTISELLQYHQKGFAERSIERLQKAANYCLNSVGKVKALLYQTIQKKLSSYYKPTKESAI